RRVTPGRGLISGLIRQRSAGFSTHQPEPIGDGQGRWRIIVNGSKQNWKACLGQPLRSSNLLSSATLTRQYSWPARTLPLVAGGRWSQFWSRTPRPTGVDQGIHRFKLNHDGVLPHLLAGHVTAEGVQIAATDRGRLQITPIPRCAESAAPRSQLHADPLVLYVNHGRRSSRHVRTVVHTGVHLI